jgi:hypothetical protein
MFLVAPPMFLVGQLQCAGEARGFSHVRMMADFETKLDGHFFVKF